jgi:hypothetical protein
LRRVLQQHRECAGVRRVGRRADDHLDAKRLRPGAHHVLRLGKDIIATKNRALPRLPIRWQSVIASAAAVASSSIDALAIAMPVRSLTMVWKLISASNRPCEISG